MTNWDFIDKNKQYQDSAIPSSIPAEKQLKYSQQIIKLVYKIEEMARNNPEKAESIIAELKKILANIQESEK